MKKEARIFFSPEERSKQLYQMQLYFRPKILAEKIGKIEALIAGVAGSYGENQQRKYCQFFKKIGLKYRCFWY